MLKKLNQLAEQAATNVSRRQFLGRIGRGAGVAAAACAGLLIQASPARAGRGGTKTVPCCRYEGGYMTCGGHGTCPKFLQLMKGRNRSLALLVSGTQVPSCDYC